MKIEQPLDYTTNNISEEMTLRANALEEIDKIKKEMSELLSGTTIDKRSDVLEKINDYLNNLKDREENQKIIKTLEMLKDTLENA